MTDTILWRPGWTGLDWLGGVMSEVSGDRCEGLAGFGIREANRVTDTISRFAVRTEPDPCAN